MTDIQATREGIERAQAALQRGEPEAALLEAIAAWRTLRHPALATAVEGLSSRVGERRPLPVTRTQQQALASWLDRAHARDDLDLDPLLDALDHWFANRPKAASLAPLLEELAERAPDPRYTAHLERWHAGCAALGGTRARLLLRVARLTVAGADPRSLPFLQDHRPREAKQLQRALAALPQTDPTTEAACVALRAAVESCEPTVTAPPVTEDELLGRVYAAPRDDTPRSVYADWLQERGEPRGELMVLQLEREGKHADAGARERALLHKHQREWLGALTNLLVLKTAVFRRGFLAECKLKPIRASDVDRHAIHPEWATLEWLRFDLKGSDRVSLISPEMRGIRTLLNVCNRGLLRLCQLDTLPVEHLQVAARSQGSRFELADNPGLQALASCTGLEELQTLELRTLRRVEDARWLLEAPLLQRISSLAVGGDVHAWLAALPNNVTTLSVGAQWTIQRRNDGTPHSLSAVIRAPLELAGFEQTLARFPRPLSSVRAIIKHYRGESPDAAVAQVRRCLEWFTELQSVDVTAQEISLR